MKINVHAGHNADGKVACGAIGIIQESTEARKVKNEVIRQLKGLGHTVYDCTVDNAPSTQTNLSQIVNKCNNHTVDIDVSIHFNSGANDKKGNGNNTGVEVFIYKANNSAKKYAKSVADEISKLGYKKRSNDTSPVSGVKISTGLYVLKHTKSPAMLIECCFVDDKDDIKLYDYRTMAAAIVKGITGKEYKETTTSNKTTTASTAGETKTGDKDALYRVQVGAYSVKTNAENMQKKLEKAGFDAFVVKS